MERQEIEAIVDERIAHSHVNCRWADVENDKITTIKQLPKGAFRMVHLTWMAFDNVGRIVGKAVAVGLFLMLLSVIFLGGTALYKGIQFFAGKAP